ncbi:hypothetical protein [Longimicrobium sp.]|uniref:TolB family protein n=1 Tax=Longimicrobium sp. TaxID=2029185 RepID=UPI002E320D77|nr:hypothetical protein [Longimicrobium sp.]HEX6039955.1 hypothetical protein [Longimicrobium sp.]
MAAQPIMRRAALHAACACLLALSACSDGPSAGPTEPTLPAPAAPGEDVQAVRCEADVQARTVICEPYEAAPASGASLVRTLGAQGVDVRVTSSNVQYDSVTKVFGVDVTVQNLLVQKMGTADGTTVSGITVYFYAGPNVSTQGSAEVRNPDGRGFFTGAQQPYFHWNEVLPLNAVSSVKHWEFDVSSAATRFQFMVHVRTELLPVVLFDRSVGGNRDIYRVALDGSDLVRMTKATGDDVNPTVGGNLVVFTSYRTGNAELWSMPLTASADDPQTRLTTTSAAETEPALSADGTRLAYVSNAQFGTGKVWTASPTMTGAARATPAGFGLDGAPELAPAWAPTGNHLALVSTGNGSPDVFDYAMPGTPVLVSGHADYSEVDPAWSLDPTPRLVYVSTKTGGGDLYLRGSSTPLTTNPGADASPTWLRDGRIVYQEWAVSGGTVTLKWLDPTNPARSGVILPAGGGRIDRPFAVPY